MMPKLPKAPPYESKIPKAPSVPDYRQNARKLQGYQGILQARWGKLAPKLNPSWAKGTGKYK
jgi:hypothetical protein